MYFRDFPNLAYYQILLKPYFFQDLPKYNTGSFFKAYTQNLKRLLIHISINRDKLVYYK